jgi:hypothetical protein
MDGQLRQWGEDEKAAGDRAANAWQEFFAGQGAPAADRAAELQATGPIIEARHQHEDRLLRLATSWAWPQA